jgi:deoxyribodipyrimidine photolyase-like uncharacterized protein|tara:strand:+ start:1023 stop:1574 length:552 start_codon:yes stop_codon:yes gene_type:complete
MVKKDNIKSMVRMAVENSPTPVSKAPQGSKQHALDVNKHIEDTVRKFEGGKPLIKKFRNDDPSTYLSAQKPVMDTWDLLKKSAQLSAAKGDYSEMRDIKQTLREQYTKNGGQWMSDDEKKLINKYKSPEPVQINIDGITKGRLMLEQIREEDKRLEEQKKKIFEKNKSHENISGLAYLLNTKE